LAKTFFEGTEVSRGVDTTIELPTGNGSEKVNLCLCNRTVIRLESSRDLRTMQQFNRIVNDWKRYGFVKFLRSSEGSVTLKDPLNCFDKGGDPTSGSRSCMFVPLEQQDDDNSGIKIDQDLMNRVVDYNIEPYYSASAITWKLPLIGGQIRSHHFAFLFGLASVAFTSFQCYVMEAGATINDASDWAKLFIADSARTFSLGLAFLALVHFAISLCPPKKIIDDETLLNRFFTQSAGMSGLFVLNRRNWRAGSKQDALTTFDVSSDDEEGPHKSSCYEIYSKRYSTRLRYKTHPLLSAKLVKKHAKEDLLRIQDDSTASSSAGDIIHLPPELLHILPCPRDVLYVCGQHFETILVSLERTITLMSVERRLQELEETNSLTIIEADHPANDVPSSFLYNNLDEGDDPLQLLDKATGLFPSPTYQRLEFLGDAILNHALAINLFAKNSNLHLDADALGDNISLDMNNKQLGQAALRVGVSKVLGVGRSKSRECSQGTLSDVVESLIAVFFIGNPGGSGVVGLFNELELSSSLSRGEHETKGFVALSPCFTGPYPFDLHKSWNRQVVAVGTNLMVNYDIDERLEKGYDLLCNILDGKGLFREALSSQRTKILLRCALFDDDGESGESSIGDAADDTTSLNSFAGSSSQTPLKGLNRVGIFRENLFFIGNYSLNLCISAELYKRFPDASPKDLTLLTFCAFTDEVMAYILTKSKLIDCLFDKDSPSAAQFWLEMKLADKRGTEIWVENGGWLLGGIDDYQRRLGKEGIRPRYPGLGGGLLVGHLKKLDKDLTEDLAFSMKAICGALVLSLGVDGMWSAMRSLFREAMILTPKENRRLYGKNSVCQGWT